MLKESSNLSFFFCFRSVCDPDQQVLTLIRAAGVVYDFQYFEDV